ncbi:MAG: PPOX class F420-dependent oxidoreductase [Nitrososphaerota archaeon]|nr:PPOX class F420-dependent oxidoreductase [Candidatus Calditenuaceae archaeon]MDW8073475.1 PPOX class F420-dependent oxidoreductase [Nitrososphaerota archaeon]
MVKLLPEVRSLVEGKNIGFVATVMPNGSPQVTPVWVDIEGDYVLINTVKGRRKDKNTDRDPRVSIAIADAANPYRYVEIRGRVVEKTAQGAVEHIDRLARKYLGAARFEGPRSNRLIWKIKPEKIVTF